MKIRINIIGETHSHDVDEIRKSTIVKGITYNIKDVVHHVPETSIQKIVFLKE